MKNFKAFVERFEVFLVDNKISIIEQLFVTLSRFCQFTLFNFLRTLKKYFIFNPPIT